MVLWTSTTVSFRDLMAYNGVDCCVQKNCFHLGLSKLFKWNKIVRTIHRSISGTNISLLIGKYDHPKDFRRLRNQLPGWDTCLALAVTPKEYLKYIQNYLLKKNQVTLRNIFAFHSVLVLRQSRRTLHPCFTITWDIVTLSYFFFFFFLLLETCSIAVATRGTGYFVVVIYPRLLADFRIKSGSKNIDRKLQLYCSD